MNITSGKYKLKKLTKTQALIQIRDTGIFDGFICGNRVNPYHIANGWYLGHRITTNSKEKLNQYVENLNLNLQIYTPELGSYTHFYKIIDKEE